MLEAAADVLISTANPWLNMSGGVNGAIYACAPTVQTELRNYLKSKGRTSLPAGSVVPTSAGSLPFQHILHAVAIDAFYDSSLAIVSQTITTALELAVSLGAHSVALPALATGYGPLTVEEFANAFAQAPIWDLPLESATIVVRHQTDRALMEDGLKARSGGD